MPGKGELLEGEDRIQDQRLFALQGGMGFVDAKQSVVFLLHGGFGGKVPA